MTFASFGTKGALFSIANQHLDSLNEMEPDEALDSTDAGNEDSESDSDSELKKKMCTVRNKGLLGNFAACMYLEELDEADNAGVFLVAGGCF